jgi:hypothetical protein
MSGLTLAWPEIGSRRPGTDNVLPWACSEDELPGRLLRLDTRAGGNRRRRGLDAASVADQVDDANTLQSIEYELDRECREQETEDLLRDEHSALI